MKNWYSIQAKAGAKSADISIYDEIGYFGVTAKQFIGDLKALDVDTLKLSINSPGGAVFDALAMYNALRQHPANVEVTIMGVAASAASVIAMAGDTVVMPENAFMMIHNPLNMAYGNADDLREMADVLDKIGASLVGIYAARTGKPEDEIKAMLDAETWLNAEDAVLHGFADELQPALKVAASFDLDRLPETVRAAIVQTTITTTTWTEGDEEDPAADPADDAAEAAARSAAAAAAQAAAAQAAERALASSIITLSAQAGIAALADAFILDPSIQSEADAKASIAEAKEIIAVCAAAKLPGMADRLVKARVPLASVRAQLIEARAALDAALPINHHIPQPTNSPQSACSIAGIYAARRNPS